MDDPLLLGGKRQLLRQAVAPAIGKVSRTTSLSSA